MGEGRWNIRPTPTGIFHSSLFGYLVVEAVGNPSRGNWKGGQPFQLFLVLGYSMQGYVR